jgi:hypothetical protein
MPNLFAEVDEFPESDGLNRCRSFVHKRHFGQKPGPPSGIQFEFRCHPQQHSLPLGSSVRLPRISVLESYVQLILRARDVPAIISSGLLFAVGLRLSLSLDGPCGLAVAGTGPKDTACLARETARQSRIWQTGASYSSSQFVNGLLRAGTRSSDVPMSRRSRDARLKRETERRENRIAGNPVLGRELMKPSRAEGDLLLARLECVREDRTDCGLQRRRQDL